MSENDAAAVFVADLTSRINELEKELTIASERLNEVRERAAKAEQENHALRARLTAIALVIRP
jgi:chromosome segregation ATPase